MLLNCLIIEDEKLAQDILKKYILLVPSLVLKESFSNASDAISYLHANEIDLIFLDINMPELNGIDFLKSLQNPPKIIITTAYSEYAIDGYEYSVCDYLLKPIRYERFVKAINKVIEQLKPALNSSPKKAIESASILIKEGGITHKIDFNELLFVEAFGNYLKIYIKNTKTIIYRATLSDIESILPQSIFFRVHKSYLVNTIYISGVKNSQIEIFEHKIPIGITFKNEVLKRVGHKK